MVILTHSALVFTNNPNVHRATTERQGSRTPHTDPLARGAFVGLTLSHTRAHIFRAILESVCYGTRSCFDALEAAAEVCSNPSEMDVERSNEVVIAGGKLMEKQRVLESLLSYHF